MSWNLTSFVKINLKFDLFLQIFWENQTLIILPDFAYSLRISPHPFILTIEWIRFRRLTVLLNGIINLNFFLVVASTLTRGSVPTCTASGSSSGSSPGMRLHHQHHNFHYHRHDHHHHYHHSCHYHHFHSKNHNHFHHHYQYR